MESALFGTFRSFTFAVSRCTRCQASNWGLVACGAGIGAGNGKPFIIDFRVAARAGIDI
jgi:hypothetical protein